MPAAALTDGAVDPSGTTTWNPTVMELAKHVVNALLLSLLG